MRFKVFAHAHAHTHRGNSSLHSRSRVESILDTRRYVQFSNRNCANVECSIFHGINALPGLPVPYEGSTRVRTNRPGRCPEKRKKEARIVRARLRVQINRDGAKDVVVFNKNLQRAFFYIYSARGAFRGKKMIRRDKRNQFISAPALPARSLYIVCVKF